MTARGPLASSGLYYDALTDRMMARSEAMAPAKVAARAMALIGEAERQGRTVGQMQGEVCRVALNYAEAFYGERCLTEGNPLVDAFLMACDQRLKSQGKKPWDYFHTGREDFRDGTKFVHAIQRKFVLSDMYPHEEKESEAAEKTVDKEPEMKQETIQHLLNLSLPPSAPARAALASPASIGIEYRPPADSTANPEGHNP